MDGEEESHPSESDCSIAAVVLGCGGYTNVDVAAIVVIDYVVVGLINPTQDIEHSNNRSPYSSCIHHYQLSSEAYSDGWMMAEKRVLKQIDQGREKFRFLAEF